MDRIPFEDILGCYPLRNRLKFIQIIQILKSMIPTKHGVHTASNLYIYKILQMLLRFMD